MRIRSLARMFANSLNHLCHKRVIIQQYLIDNFQLTDIHTVLLTISRIIIPCYLRLTNTEIDTLKIL